jgi:hypothetical protein
MLGFITLIAHPDESQPADIGAEAASPRLVSPANR